MDAPKKRVSRREVIGWTQSLTHKALSLQRSVISGALTPAQAKEKMQMAIKDVQSVVAEPKLTAFNKALSEIRAAQKRGESVAFMRKLAQHTPQGIKRKKMVRK